MQELRSEKTLSVQEHQDELLKLSTNLSQANILKLVKEFRSINIELSEINPPPPVNITQKYNQNTFAASVPNRESNSRKTLIQAIN